MNLLVTGGTGFIGLNLIKRLVLDGHNVFVLVRQSSDTTLLPKEVKVIYYQSDAIKLGQEFLCNQINCVFHLASLFISEHASEDVENLIDSNIKFGVVVLEAMKVAKVKALINTSTSWEYYEGLSYNPVCLYSATKRAFSDIIDYYVNTVDLSCLTLFIYDTYGEGDTRKKIFQLFKRLCITGEALKMSPGKQEIDLVYIDDIVSAYVIALNLVLCMKMHESFGVYSGNAINLRELVLLIEKVTGRILNIEWGERPYRDREVMKPSYPFEALPGWSPKISINDGIRIFHYS